MKQKHIRLFLTVVLFVLVSVSFMGEKVAKDGGIGWDGEIYLNTIQTFSDRFFTHGYDQYGIQRVLPYGLVNILFQLCGIRATAESALWAAGFLSLIALGFCVFYFFRISSLMGWGLDTEVIAFASLFYSYPILKTLGYYILQSDIFGFLLGIMLLYFFLSKNKWALVACSVVGAFVWPVVSICGLALAFFPSDEIQLNSFTGKKDLHIWRGLVYLTALAPFFILVLSIIWCQEGVMTPFRGHCPLTMPRNGYWAFFNCACSCVFLLYVTSAFRVSVTSLLKDLFNSKTYWRWVAFIVSYLLIALILRILANDEQGNLTAKSAAVGVVLTSMTDPFVFIENHFIYFGPAILVVLLSWRRCAKYSLSYGAGYMFVFAAGVFFSLRPESRVTVSFLPFLLFPTMCFLDSLSLKRWVKWGYVLLCLVVSRFWFPINVPGMERYLAWDNLEHYTEFPAQRYFMSTGHWQSHEMYVVFMTVTVVCLIVFYYGAKRQWFIRRENDGDRSSNCSIESL